MNRRILLLVAALLLSSTALAQRAVGSFERTLTVDEPIELDVTTGSGRIQVRGGPAGRVTVQGEISAWRGGRGGIFGFRWGNRNWRLTDEEVQELVDEIQADPPVELAGNRLRVGHMDEPGYWQNLSISYEIEVPADSMVRSRSGSGAQTISGVRGRVETSAGSGSVTLRDVGPAEARAGSGSIRAEGVAGSFRASAGSGSVRLEQTEPGDVEISTGSGSSEARGVDGALRMRAGSGSLTAEGRLTGPWQLEAGSGSIRVRLPQDAAFDLDAEARSGGIYTDHPVTVQGRDGRGRLSGTVRGGGPLLRVRAGSGSIQIE